MVDPGIVEINHRWLNHYLDMDSAIKSLAAQHSMTVNAVCQHLVEYEDVSIVEVEQALHAALNEKFIRRRINSIDLDLPDLMRASLH